MSRKPDARFVVQDVIAQSARRGLPPLADNMLNPARLVRRIGRKVSIVRIVAGHILAAGQDSGPCIWKPLIVTRLGAVLSDRETGKLCAIWPEFRNPADHGNGDQRLSAAALAGRYEGVAALSRCGARVPDAFEIPVLVLVIRIDLPVIAARVVAAISIAGEVQI